MTSIETIGVKLVAEGAAGYVGDLTKAESAEKGLATATTAMGHSADAASKSITSHGKAAASTASDHEKLASSTKHASDAAHEHSGIVGHLTEQFGGLKTVLLGAGTAFAAAFEVKEAISAASELGTEVNKMRRELGLSAEDASKLHFAAQELGIPFDNMERSLVKFEKGLAGVSDAEDLTFQTGKALKDNIATLGIQVDDASGQARPLTDVLGDLADKFKEMPDGTQKTALAIQLFGKSGAELLPLLNQGRDGLAEFGDEAEKLGLVLDDKQAGALKRQKMAMREFHAALEGIQVQIGIALIPVITAFTKGLTFLAVEFNQNVVPAIGKFSDLIGELVGLAWDQISGPLGDIASAGVDLAGAGWQWFINTAIPKLIDWAGAIPGFAASVLKWADSHKVLISILSPGLGLALLIYDNWKTLIDFVRNDVIPTLKDWGELGFNAVMEAGSATIDWITGTALPALQSFGETANEALNQYAQSAQDAFTGFDYSQITDALAGLGSAFADLGAALEPVAELYFPLLRDIGKELLDALGPLGDALSKQLGPTFQSLQAALVPMLPVLQTIGQILGVTLVAAGYALLEVIKLLIPILGDVLVGAINSAAAVIQGLAGTIEGAFQIIQGVFDTFKGLFTGDWDEFWKGIQEIFTGVWTGLSAIFETAWALFSTAIETALSVLNELTGGKLGEWKDAFVNAFNDVVDWFGGLKDRIVGAIGSALDWLVSTGTDVVTGLSNGIINAFETIRDAIWIAKDEAINALGNAADWLVDIGYKIIQGLKNGIIEGAGGLLGDIGGSIKDTVIGSLSDAFGIFSPSKVAAEKVGKPIVDGIAVGMRDGIPALTYAVNGVVSAISDGLWKSDLIGASTQKGLAAWRDVLHSGLTQGIELATEDMNTMFNELRGIINESGLNTDMANAAKSILDSFVSSWLSGKGVANQQVIDFINGLIKEIQDNVKSATLQPGVSLPGSNGLNTPGVTPGSPSQQGWTPTNIGGGKTGYDPTDPYSLPVGFYNPTTGLYWNGGNWQQGPVYPGSLQTPDPTYGGTYGTGVVQPPPGSSSGGAFPSRTRGETSGVGRFRVPAGGSHVPPPTGSVPPPSGGCNCPDKPPPPPVNIDMRGVQMTGTPADNERMMLKVVNAAIAQQMGRAATNFGVVGNIRR